MAHRGRISVLAHVLGKPLPLILGEFQGKHGHLADASTGDVKYHLGFERTHRVGDAEVTLSLVPNPSHLEIVNPVLQGTARALQRDAADRTQRDEATVVPVCIHGTRHILPSHQVAPRPGTITVGMLAVLHPVAGDAEAAAHLRDESRRLLLSHLGEPDLSDEPAQQPLIGETA